MYQQRPHGCPQHRLVGSPLMVCDFAEDSKLQKQAFQEVARGIRRIALGAAEPRRDLLRLPFKRSHQQSHASCVSPGDAVSAVQPDRGPPARCASYGNAPSSYHATLRGVFVQGRFGSQRALTTVEDFTEFEQRGAYFDGDDVITAKKGINILERGHQVNSMAEFQEMLGFPPAPKLDVLGKLDPGKAAPDEMREQEIFFGKGQCGTCHAAPYYTHNLMHDLKIERFFKGGDDQRLVGDKRWADQDLPLRGIKHSSPYMHDGRLLTLGDTVEFFNLILGTKLTGNEKQDLAAFLRAL
jgi:hypothetical protein